LLTSFLDGIVERLRLPLSGKGERAESSPGQGGAARSSLASEDERPWGGEVAKRSWAAR